MLLAVKMEYVFWLFDATSEITNQRVCNRLKSLGPVKECSVIPSPDEANSYRIRCTAEFESPEKAEEWLKRVYAWYSIKGVEYNPLNQEHEETLSK